MWRLGVIFSLFTIIISLLSFSRGYAPGEESNRLPLSAAASTRVPGVSPRIHGTFLQLQNSHSGWAEDKWRRLFENFRQLQISQLVVQWTVWDGVAFFTSKDYKATANPPLEKILRLSDEYGVQVYVGLAGDPRYWETIEKHPRQVERYFQRMQAQSESLADQLFPLVQKHSSFAGWYLTEEIDDVNWVKPESRKILFDFLQKLSNHLRRLTPSAKIALSGFSNAHMDPIALEKFWSELLSVSAIDVVMFQDGIGVGKLELAYLDLYLKALRNAVDRQSRDLQVIVELFRQVSEEPFEAVPASLSRIKSQLELAGRYSSKIMAFSVPEYMTPLAGPKAEQLFNSYLGEMR